VRNAASRLGVEDALRRSETWRPWRSYALLRLWSVVLDEMRPGHDPTGQTPRPGSTDEGDIG
jgi:AraC family transcriptional regulator of adaptative response / DNA-3-methyladenine glycosylase II